MNYGDFNYAKLRNADLIASTKSELEALNPQDEQQHRRLFERLQSLTSDAALFAEVESVVECYRDGRKG